MQDHVSSSMYKRIEYHALKHQLSNLTDKSASKRVSASQSAVIGSIATQNRRLLQGESTSNVSVASSERSVREIDGELHAIECKIKELD